MCFPQPPRPVTCGKLQFESRPLIRFASTDVKSDKPFRQQPPRCYEFRPVDTRCLIWKDLSAPSASELPAEHPDGDSWERLVVRIRSAAYRLRLSGVVRYAAGKDRFKHVPQPYS